MYTYYLKPIQEQLEKFDISTDVQLLTPPNLELGDICIVVNKFAGEQNPEELAYKLQKNIEVEGIDNISVFSTPGKKKKKGGIVYLNFSINEDMKQKLQTEYLKKAMEKIFSSEFGYLDTNKGKSSIVEHTSANPISPLHVGNIRNSVHGDTLARILERTGYTVHRHFYVNDVGLQVSFVVLGYEITKNANFKPTVKFDIWLGQVYAIMNCLYTIQSIKRKGMKFDLELDSGYKISDEERKLLETHYNGFIVELEKDITRLEKIEKPSKEEKKEIKQNKTKLKKIIDDLNEVIKYQKTYKNLQERFPDLFNLLYEGVSKIDLIDVQSTYLMAYEKKSDERIVDLFKEMTLWVLSSFEWTLKRYNIEFDQFDFESDVSWSGLPSELIDTLAKSEYATHTGEQGVRLQYPKEAIQKLLKETGLTKKDIPIKGNVPDLQLRRSNGTALYAAKDIAYSIKKFKDKNPEFVYNVISTEQSLPQFQLLLPLLELGYPEYAKGLKHYAYELVDLLGRPMSGRMASYVTADAFYDETFIRSRMAKRESDKKRGMNPPSTAQEWEKENNILHAVTLASTRYPLIDKLPTRRIVLDIDQALDFRRNPGPFIQYAHARASGILRNAEEAMSIKPNLKINWELIVDDFTMEIIKHLSNLEEEILKSWNNLDPSVIANWCLQLAQLFMKYYERYPVLNAENKKIVRARLLVIDAIRLGIANGLDILGIPATERL